MAEAAIQLQPLQPADGDWVAEMITRHWGSTTIVSRGRIHDVRGLPGFAALQEGKVIGLVTYQLENDECEVVSLNSLVESQGVGTALLAAIQEAARSAGCRRVWLVTTNDNLKALKFYQKRGYELVAVHQGAIRQARKLKPSIPQIGLEGIPIRDEIELELLLAENR